MRRAGTIVAAFLVVGAAGCGGTSGPDSDSGDDVVVVEDDVLFAAAETTLSAGTARMAMDVSFDGGRGEAARYTAALTIKADGIVNLDTGESEITIDMSSLLDAVPPGEELPFDADDLIMEMRMVDGIAYMRAGGLFGTQLGVGTEWISIDSAAALEEFGVDAEAFSQLQNQASFTDYVEMLAAASGDVDELGREDVRGEETTHYRATLDLGRLMEQGLEQLPDGLREELEAELEAGEDLDDAFGQFTDMFAGVKVPSEIWVDDAGRLRKQTMRLGFAEILENTGEAVARELRGVDMLMTIEFYDYGVEVDVEPPSDDEVTDLLELLEGRSRLD